MAYRVGLDKIDVSDDIVLDADGDNITFKAGSDDALGLDFSQSGGGSWSFGPTTSNKDLSFKVNVGGSQTNAMILKGSNGYLGIGVSDPDAHLEVAGMVHISGEQGSAPSQPSNGDGGYLYTKADGKVYWRSNELSETDLTAAGGSGADVGSANTFTEAQVISKDQDSEFVALVLKNESDANDTTGLVSLRFDLEDTGGTAVDSAKIAVKKEAAFTATASTQDSSMVLSTSLNGTLTEHATLTSAGNLGIGVSDPDSKLEVLSTGTQAKFSYDADSFYSVTVTDDSHTTVTTGETGNLFIDPGGDLILQPGGATPDVKVGLAAGSSNADLIMYSSNNNNQQGLQWDADGFTNGALLGGRSGNGDGTLGTTAGGGVDFRFYGAGDGSGNTQNHYVQWDNSGNELVLKTNSKLSFHDAAGGENIVASADGHLEVNAGTTLDLSAPTVDINGTSNGTVQIDTGANGNFNVNSDTTTFSSSASQDPLVIIKNTTNNAGGSRLHFVKDNRNSTADGGGDPGGGDDSDDLGVIEFIGDNDAAQQTSFAKIFAEVSESADGDEAGRLSLLVAESNGTSSQLTAGLVLEGEEGTDGEVDVTIAAGANSLTTIAGETLFTGITRMNTQSVTMSGTGTTITPTAPLIFLDTSSAAEFASGMGTHLVSMSTSGATDGDVVHMVMTTNPATGITIQFGDSSGGDGNVLVAGSSGGKYFHIGSANTIGAAFTMVYVNSASKWAVLGHNALASI